MNQQLLIQGLSASAGKVPDQADVIGLQQFTLADLHGRTQHFLSMLGEQEKLSFEHGDWQVRDDHTAVRLPQGARAMLYHASGSMKYSSGVAPLEALFERLEDPQQLTARLEQAAKKYKISEWAGAQGELQFERLWQMKAQGASKEGKLSEAVLCRIVGAYRQVIGGVPVLGAASVALRLAGDGRLDDLAVQVRTSAAQVLERARIVAPEVAAKQVSQQLVSLLGNAKDALPSDVIESQTMQFGYLGLGKRKAQQLLAPAFLSQVVLRHKQERQAYVFAVSATEKTYLPMCQCGGDPLAPPSRAVN